MIIVTNRVGAALVAAALTLLVIVGLTRVARASMMLDRIAPRALTHIAPDAEALKARP